MTRLRWFVALGLIVAVVVAVLESSARTTLADPLATSQAARTRIAEQRENDDQTPTPEADDNDNDERPVSDRPDGLPPRVTEAEVIGHVDGDKLRVRVGGDDREVLLIGVDAPEIDEGPMGECYAEEASAALEDLVPRGATVYLESGGDNEDNKDRLLRFLWFDDDGEAVNTNVRLLREGVGSLDDRGEESRHNNDLSEAEADAKAKDAGLWGECGENHVERSTPTPTTSLGGAGRANQDTTEPTDGGEGFSDEEREYANTIVSQTRLLGTSFDQASELFASPQIGDETWTIQVAAVLAAWRVTYTEASQLTPPPAFQQIHDTYVFGLSYYDAAANNIAAGLDAFDLSLIEQGLTNLELGREQIAEATRLLDELQEERGG